MKRTKRIWALMLTLLTALCLLPGAAMAEGEYCYWHKDSSQHSGYYTYYQRSIHRSFDRAFGWNILPAVYLLYEGESKDNPTKVYCCDAATSVLPDYANKIQYRRLTLENAGYYSAKNAEKIRAITKISYPFVTKDEMAATLRTNNVSISDDITEDELLTAVQNAIWHFANEEDNVIANPYSGTWYYKWNESDTAYYDTASNKYSGYSTLQSIDTVKTNITNVYNYLIKIDPENAQDGGIVLNSVEATPLSTGTSGTVDVLLKFKLENDKHGGISITLNEKDDLTLAANGKTFPSREWRDEGNGEYSVTLQGVTAGENIDVTISGEQYLARDAYFYEPVSGRHAAQCFVGVAEGSTPVFARGSFRIDEKTERLAYLSVKKTSNRAGTYKFNVYNVKDDGAKGEIVKAVELTTTEEKPCVASEKILLPVGTYIVEEEDAIKAGYTLTVTVTANGEEHTVNSEKVENPSARVTLSADSSAEVTVEFANCYEERHTHEDHYTPEEPVPAIVVMPKTGDGSVLLSAAGLLLAAAAVCGLKRRIRG